MPTAWFIVPYKRDAGKRRPTRYPAIDDYTETIRGAGGQWAETEVLGDRCLVKVRAPAAVLVTLAGPFKRLPKDRMDDPLTGLALGAKQTLKAELEDMGYPLAEMRERFGTNLEFEAFTLGDVLRFMARRRLKPRHDAANDEIVLDGPPQSCRSIESVDVEVSEQ